MRASEAPMIAGLRRHQVTWARGTLRRLARAPCPHLPAANTAHAGHQHHHNIVHAALLAHKPRPDNLKAAVIRAAFANGDAVQFNRSYRELARHYGFVIDPTPAYSPEKKGKVESAVKYVKRSFFAAREFADVDDCNARLARWVADIAGQRVHGTTGRTPLEAFADERPHLRALPARRWQQMRLLAPTLLGEPAALRHQSRGGKRSLNVNASAVGP